MGLLPASLVNDPSPTSPTAKGTSDLSTWEKTRMLPVLIVKSKCFGLTSKGTWRNIVPTGISMLKIHNMDINSVFLLARYMLVLLSTERCCGVKYNKAIPGQKFFCDLDSLDAFIDANTTSAAPAQGWMCCLCARTSINKLDIKRHIESKHCSTMGFSCDVEGCIAGPNGNLHKTRHSLATHKRLKHGITDRGGRSWILCLPDCLVKYTFILSLAVLSCPITHKTTIFRLEWLHQEPCGGGSKWWLLLFNVWPEL